jgi:DNA-binding IclR family transcriptional regulator
MAPVKATVLAKTLNRTRRTVYYHLEKLQKHGLAVKTASGWLRAGAATFDAVAEARGVAGIGAAQKIRHSQDRQTRKEKWRVRVLG